MAFLMSDILQTIRDLAVNELEDLGSDTSTQNNAIFRFVNVVLRKRARQAYNVEFSDPLTLSGDDDYTFQLNGVDIEDMYEPLGVTVGTKYGRTINGGKRTSFENPSGWWRESDNQPINIRGATGDVVLKYIRYPAAVTTSGDTVEYPLAGQWDLIFDVVKLIKLPKNMYDEADAVGKNATGTATVKASIAAKGTNSAPPSMTDKED